MVPLKTLVDIQYDTRPSNLKRFQQLNSATFQAMPAPGTTQGQIYSYLQNTAQQIMPRTMETGTKGSLRQFIQEGNTLLWAFLFAIIVIFLLLAAQFESYRDPFIILITVPLSICGALIPTYLLSLFGVGYATINIYTQVGLVTLIGLISKHGILMVEFANQLQDEGIAKMKAIKQAASIRLRPILMTTAAMVFGVIPLMTASGAGAASRNAIGLIIFFGLSIGTLFTLFVIPVIYSYLAKDRQIMLQKMKEQKRQIDELENEASDSS
jgi:multidrug efflux pump